MDKINLKKNSKYVALSNLYICFTWKNIKKSYKNNKIKISAPTWNVEFELSDGSYSVSNIKDYFEYILKNMEKRLLKIYANKIENRTTFKIKTGYYLEFSTSETTKLLGSTRSKITKNENGKKLSYLEITEVVLAQCNIVNNNYQQNSRF